MDNVELWKLARRDPAAARRMFDDVPSTRKLPPAVVQAMLSDARPYREIAADFGVAHDTVQSVKLRRTHAQVPFEGPPRPRRVSAEMLDKAKAALEPLAAEYGVSLRQLIVGLWKSRV